MPSFGKLAYGEDNIPRNLPFWYPMPLWCSFLSHHPDPAISNVSRVVMQRSRWQKSSGDGLGEASCQEPLPNTVPIRIHDVFKSP